MTTPLNVEQVMIPKSLLVELLWWAYCPIQGGYADGRSIEDTCESLAEAVEKLTGISTRGDDWLSEEELIEKFPILKPEDTDG